MIILKKPEVNHYNNADHVSFSKQSLQIFTTYGTIIDAPVLISAYSDAVLQEDKIYKWIRKSEFTDKKAETDHARDLIIKGIDGIVRANLNHFDPATRNAAHKIYILIENYGNMTAMGYDAETVAIDSLISRLLSTEYLESVTLLHLSTWIYKMQELNQLFKTYVDDTEHEEISKPDISQKAARHETDGTLRPIISRIEALINLNGPDTFVDFSEEYNLLVTHYNTIVHERYGRLHARIDISAAIIDTIPPQPYTGRSVFVIPTVRLHKEGTEAIELIFTEDFTVAYRNNVNPGTATLIITGIGKYKGEVVTTFNISLPPAPSEGGGAGQDR
jgi:hypothetical protein